MIILLQNIELYDEDITLLTMHDLVHDLARTAMDNEIFVVSKGDNAQGSCYHYALLDDCTKPLVSELSKIRALRFMKCDKITVHDAAFSSANSLRVLDLSECIIHKLPDSIGVLKQLRYLNAPGVQHTTILDSITKLSKLIYLDIHGSPTIVKLPKSIGDTDGLGLVYLNLSGCSRLAKLPESFKRLQKLVHLDLSNCSCVGGISVLLGNLTQLQYLNLSHCQKIGEMPEALGVLSKLEYLNLSFSSYLESCQEEVLGALNKLEYLNLSSKHCSLLKLPEALGTFIQLKYLSLSGCERMSELPRSFPSLKNLVHLDLSYCHRICFLDEALVGLSNLQHLNLQGTCIKLLPEDVNKLRYLNVSRLKMMSEDTMDSFINYICSNLSNLEHLDLSDNILIKRIPKSICNLRKLHTLNLSECRFLRWIPESIVTIDSLKFLDINGCSNISKVPQLGSSAISLPYFRVRRGDGHCSSSLVLLQHIDPVVLKLTKLENVKSVEEVHRINLAGKTQLEDLTLEWTQDAERFVDHKILMENLVPPITLKKLEICGYSGMSFPAWLVGQLPNLKHLVFRGMANLEEWNTSYSSCGEHVIGQLEIHDCPLLRMKPLPPKAWDWVISNSDNVLSSWEECTGPHADATSSVSPVITTELSVKNCKVPMHQWRLLQHFPGLTSLSIKGSVDLTGSPDVIQHLSSLETLTLQDEDLEELPKWLNENKGQLTKLNLIDCNSMASLPHWLGELTSLKKLRLWGCAVLSYLPKSIQQLTSLHTLDITRCPELKCLGESVCLLPSSLRELKIWRCNGIKCLPEGMEQLTNLQKLVICNCPDLRQWCELEENKMKLAHIEEKNIFFPAFLREFFPAEMPIWSLPAQYLGNHLFVDNVTFALCVYIRLEICGYNGVSFPAWLVVDNLPNLEHLELKGMANLEEWNTLYSSG
ncbi:hypothetical protein ACQ4PT_064784 [Festuca glaucescens]